MKPETLHRFVVLAAIAETGSLSGAARQLGVGKSAVSHHLSALEREIGAKVAHRQGRGVALTEVGKVLAGHASNIARQVSLAMRAVRKSESPQGRVRVSLPAGLGDMLLIPMLCSFMNRYPEITIDATATDEFLEVDDGQFDVAYRIHGKLIDGLYVARPLIRMLDIFVASPTYLANVAPIAKPDDLVGHSFIGFAPFGISQRHEFKRDGRVYSIDLHCRAIASASLTTKHWVLEGAGIGRFPFDTVAAELGSGALVRLLPDYEHTIATLSAIYMPERYRPGNVQRLIEHTIAYFEIASRPVV